MLLKFCVIVYTSNKQNIINYHVYDWLQQPTYLHW